jgi:cell division protein FtsW
MLIIILLVVVLITGAENKGGVRRIFGTQPSLFARVLIILYFAHILDKKKHELDDTKPKGFLKNFATLIVMSILVFSLIFLGRHLSILIILGITLFSMLWLANIKFSTMMVILSIIPILLVSILLFGRDYRKERMSIYPKYSLFHKAVGIEKEYFGNKDYQIRESLISLAGGKFFGTGSTRGTGKHYFLPEARTDYIFSIIGEEFGFVASLLILGLYVFLFIRVILLGNRMNSLYLKLLTYGLGMNIFYNAMVNIGVAMSALPSTGVTLPFISYGGTSLLVNSFSVGLLLNVSSIRKDYREIR